MSAFKERNDDQKPAIQGKIPERLPILPIEPSGSEGEAIKLRQRLIDLGMYKPTDQPIEGQNSSDGATIEELGKALAGVSCEEVQQRIYAGILERKNAGSKNDSISGPPGELENILFDCENSSHKSAARVLQRFDELRHPVEREALLQGVRDEIAMAKAGTFSSDAGAEAANLPGAEFPWTRQQILELAIMLVKSGDFSADIYAELSALLAADVERSKGEDLND